MIYNFLCNLLLKKFSLFFSFFRIIIISFYVYFLYILLVSNKRLKDHIILYQLNSYQLKDKYNQAYIYFYLVSASLSLFVFLLPLKYLLEPHQSSSFLYHKESILVLVLIILLLFYLMFFDIVV